MNMNIKNSFYFCYFLNKKKRILDGESDLKEQNDSNGKKGGIFPKFSCNEEKFLIQIFLSMFTETAYKYIFIYSYISREEEEKICNPSHDEWIDDPPFKLYTLYTISSNAFTTDGFQCPLHIYLFSTPHNHNLCIRFIMWLHVSYSVVFHLIIFNIHMHSLIVFFYIVFEAFW